MYIDGYIDMDMFILFLVYTNNVFAEINRIISGNENAKITIIAYESLTCSHCADFHKDVYPELKRDYIDTGLAKIEFRHFPLDIAAFNASKIAQCKNDKSLIILENLEASSKGRSGIINPATPALDANSQKFSSPKFKMGLK